MDNKITIGVGVVVLAGVGYYFYNKNKSQMSNIITTQSVTENKSVTENIPVSSGKYNNEEATAKALVTVKDWIKIYDGLSSDVLSQESRNKLFIQKQINELKNKLFPVASANLQQAELAYLNNKLLLQDKSSLKDAIKRLKDLEYSKLYNALKQLYAKYPKADVDKLMTILPKYLSGFMLGDDYQYTYDVFNGFSIDDKLYLSDIDFNKNFEEVYKK